MQLARPVQHCALPCSRLVSRYAHANRWRHVARAEGKDSGAGTQLQKAGEKASKAVQGAVDSVKEAFDVIDDNILDYCNLDAKGGRPKSRRSLGEKEQDFLDALRSFYYDEKPSMSNEEFDNLKEELLWEGSKVAILSGTEQRFMQASMAAAAGKSIISDEEYDKLKAELRKKNSVVVQQGPRCSLRTRNMYSDANPDYLKMTALNVPATIAVLLVLFSIDDITGFEITRLVELPEPYGIAVVWGAVLPIVFIFVASITNIVFKDNLILRGPCPNCGANNSTYFGDILTVKGNREVNKLDCQECKATLEFNANKREIKVQAFPGEKKKAAPAKKKAPAAKQQQGGDKGANNNTGKAQTQQA
jgi:transcription elongation factor Elf1